MLWVFFCSFQNLLAVPASSGNLILSQAGANINVTQMGDEYYHWFQSDNGYSLSHNAAGNIEFLSLSSGNLVLSGIEFHLLITLVMLKQILLMILAFIGI